MRMNGYRVFFPIGFDAFGLPAENAAIQRGIQPREWTYSNIERMRVQLRQMGAMFDFDAEVVTCDPEYYRWNQWFFVKFFEKGLAYRQEAPVDWCPKDNTTLAREQVVGPDRRCERCGTPVIKKYLAQWLFKITDYAEELLDFSNIDWPERVETLQRNWIGRSEGAEIRFEVEDYGPVEVFTTRPDTLFGATFFVMSPEHPAVERITTAEQADEVRAYVERAGRMSEIDRTDATREKTGVFTGAYAINPANGEKIPVYIADYVLMGYGTGAIMAVPAHDERDFEFATKHGIEIRTVIAPPDWDGEELEEPYAGEGTMVNSDGFDGTPSPEGKERVTAWLEERGAGKATVTYRLHDWLISRQRYWGTPIPMIFCDECGIVPVPEEDLPVLLPEEAEFMPTGESPLKLDPTFYNTECPRCGGPATRETDTMDTFMDSSWYWYRYLSPHYDEGPFDPERGEKWLPVDQYTGGIEHAILHLLYARFFTKVMRDLGLVDFDEPMTRLRNQGTILGPDGQKMSKSRGNVVNPQEYVDRFGSDALRCFLMFIGPWSEGGPWDGKGIEGVSRWLRRVLTLVAGGDSSGGEADPAELHAPDEPFDQEVDRRPRILPLQHFYRRAHGAHQLPARGPWPRRGGRVARGLAELRHGSRPVRAAPRRRDVGRDGGGVLGARAVMAWLRGSPDKGSGDHAHRPGKRQAARPHRSPRRHLRRGGQGACPLQRQGGTPPRRQGAPQERLRAWPAREPRRRLARGSTPPQEASGEVRKKIVYLA